MWQSQVEIQHCSVAYFNHVTTFKAVVPTVLLRGGEFYNVLRGGDGKGGEGGLIHAPSMHMYE